MEGGYDGDVAEEIEVADVLDARWEQGRSAWRSDVWRKSVSGTQWDIASDFGEDGDFVDRELAFGEFEGVPLGGEWLGWVVWWVPLSADNENGELLNERDKRSYWKRNAGLEK